MPLNGFGSEKQITEEQLELMKMDMRQLLETEITVTSVSRKPQDLHKTASAVFVITQKDIKRVGAVNLMEALRIAPGMQVSKINQNTYTISIRGFNQRSGSDKLLVLIDGRSIYSPGSSTVFWIGQDVMLEDVDRIEVIRGPGAALWGSNAVAGVINIITKTSRKTQGNLVAGGAGTEEKAFITYRHGGEMENGLTYRFYGKYRDRDDGIDANGNRAFDEKQMGQIGFRSDFERKQDFFTLQGDAYYLDSETNYPSVFISDTAGNAPVQAGLIQKGANILSRWTRTIEKGSRFIFQLYYDIVSREAQNIVENTIQKFDIDIQHDFLIGKRNNFSWGLNYQFQAYDFGGDLLRISRKNSNLFGLFIHDEITLVPETWSLIIGSKFEHNRFSGFEVQPNIRTLWTPHPNHSFWAAISRAVRIPSPRDEDATLNIFSTGGVAPIIFREVDGETEAENLTAYEFGYKFRKNSKLFFEFSGFWFDYTDLVDFVTPDGLNFRNANALDGFVYGFEVVIQWQILSNWRISGNYSLALTELKVTDSNVIATAFNAEGEPKNRIVLNSFLNITKHIQFDISYYYVSRYKAANIPEFHRLDLRLGWRPCEKLDISLVAQNLTDASHQEFQGGFEAASETQRGFFAKVIMRF